ncbi:hypothetical protein DFJ74DRAFT_688645 [Hyaloraphidium curvatum]|nr:hypothetical protein DFJ74DRAFT_698239 [Hyaloraphidium curvatum]KAI9007662.1 hypothetical protein DFJ74DRAFT_688645 [Hyaloraphidium curvatum]
MSTLRWAAVALFVPHVAMTLYMALHPQWGLLDADLIGGINFVTWLLFAYVHHLSMSRSAAEVVAMFALQAFVVWFTCYVDSVLKLDWFFGPHTYHEKALYAGWVGPVPVYATLAMYPMCYASMVLTDLLFPPSAAASPLMSFFLLPIIDNLYFTGWDVVIDPIASFEGVYVWESHQPFPSQDADGTRHSRGFNMENNWFGVPYPNYYTGWLASFFWIYLGTRMVRQYYGGGPRAEGSVYELLPLLSYAVNWLWCSSIALFGKVGNPGLVLVGIWAMGMPCLLAFAGWLSRPAAVKANGKANGKAH